MSNQISYFKIIERDYSGSFAGDRELAYVIDKDDAEKLVERLDNPDLLVTSHTLTLLNYDEAEKMLGLKPEGICGKPAHPSFPHDCKVADYVVKMYEDEA